MATPAPATARPRSAELHAALAAIVVVSVVYASVARQGLPAASGLFGHGIGVAGFVLMVVAETAYTWRKRPGRNGPGPARVWLQVHVFVGLVGPYMVLLHGAFRFRGLAGALMLLVLAVVASGVIGRFGYAEAARFGAEEGPARSGATRRMLSVWYLLHVPLSLAMFALAAVHILAALYYATLLR
jgi:cytochrome b561